MEACTVALSFWCGSLVLLVRLAALVCFFDGSKAGGFGGRGRLDGEVGLEVGKGGWKPALVYGRFLPRDEEGLIAGLSLGKNPDCRRLGEGEGGIVERD